MRATEILVGLGLTLFAAAMLLWVIPAQVPAGFARQLSPRLLPQITMWGVLGLGLWIAVAALRGKGAARPGPFVRAELVAMIALPGLVLVSLALLPLAGPLVAGGVLVLGAALMMGERNPLALILLPAGALGAGWLLLYRILGTSVS